MHTKRLSTAAWPASLLEDEVATQLLLTVSNANWACIHANISNRKQMFRSSANTLLSNSCITLHTLANCNRRRVMHLGKQRQ